MVDKGEHSINMNKDNLINLTNAIKIGSGSERSVYVHPDDPNKLVKVIHPNRKNLQTKRETNAYKRLLKRLPNTEEAWRHLPRFYGMQDTNLGKGQVVETIRDFDGEISKTFQLYLEQNGTECYRTELEQLKSYLLKYCIIFNHDISSPVNLVLQRIDESQQVLVIIDALGDHTAIKILNAIPSLARQKIIRRWDRFENSLLKFKK